MRESRSKAVPRSYITFGNENGTSVPAPWNNVVHVPALQMIDSREGVDLEKYLDIISRGGDATTAFAAVRYLAPAFRPATYRMEYTKTSKPGVTFYRGFSGNHQCLIGYNEDSPKYTDADNLALKQLYNQIAKAQSNFDGLVFLGELGETVAMLKSPLASLRDQIKDYLTTVKLRLTGASSRKFNRPGFEGWIQRTWLEFSFGMRPLISDIDGILNLIVVKTASRRRIRFMATGDSTSARELRGTLTVNSCPYDYRRVLSIRSSVRYFVGFTPDFGKPLTAAQSIGFRPERFVPTVYELLPWSWLVDYFSNIGSIIEALSYVTLKPSYICKTTKAWATASFASWPRPDMVTDKIVSLNGDAGTSTLTKISVSRAKAQLTIPSFQVKMPTRWDQWVNLLAVATTHRGLVSQLKRLI